MGATLPHLVLPQFIYDADPQQNKNDIHPGSDEDEAKVELQCTSNSSSSSIETQPHINKDGDKIGSKDMTDGVAAGIILHTCIVLLCSIYEWLHACSLLLIYYIATVQISINKNMTPKSFRAPIPPPVLISCYSSLLFTMQILNNLETIHQSSRMAKTKLK